MALLNKQVVRVLNVLSTQFSNNDSIYAITIDKSEVKVQTEYQANLVSYLKKKKFESSVSDAGYLYLVKQIGNISIRFVFTD